LLRLSNVYVWKSVRFAACPTASSATSTLPQKVQVVSVCMFTSVLHLLSWWHFSLLVVSIWWNQKSASS
jgi:hypothetical protein